MSPWTVESLVKASLTGTPVPHHPGLVLFSWNKPCTVCGMGANLELHRKRICSFDLKTTRNKTGG